MLKHIGRYGDLERFQTSAHLMCEALAERNPENADYQRDLSVSYNKMGDLFRARWVMGQGQRVL